MILKEMVNWRELFKHVDKEDFNIRLGRGIGYLLTAYPEDFVYLRGKRAFKLMEKDNFQGALLDFTMIKNKNQVKSNDLLEFSMGLISLHNDFKELNTSLFDELRFISKELENTLKEFYVGLLEGYNIEKDLKEGIKVDTEILKNIDELDLLKPITGRELKLLDRYGDGEYLRFATKEEKEELYKGLLKLGEPNLLETYATVRAKLMECLYVDNSSSSGIKL